MNGRSRIGAIERRTFLGLSAASLALGRANADECRMVRMATLGMVPFGSLVVVDNAIGDKPVRMLVDTGGWLTCFTETKAAELGLPVELRPEEGIVMYGGRRALLTKRRTG